MGKSGIRFVRTQEINLFASSWVLFKIYWDTEINHYYLFKCDHSPESHVFMIRYSCYSLITPRSIFFRRNASILSSTFGFQHVTSSPHIHQSNGQAERAVRTINSPLSNSTDPYLVLLNLKSNSFAMVWTQPCRAFNWKSYQDRRFSTH